MGVFAPVTRVSNTTGDVMVLITVNVHDIVEGTKTIPAKGYADLGYRRGIGRMGGRVSFRVEPANRSGVPAKEIFPIQVFEHAGIEIVYKLADGSVSVSGGYEDGASIEFQFNNDTLFHRIWLVRWLRGVYASASAFGE